MPETRFEVIDGEVVYVSPADPPHATLHSKLSAILEAFAADDYQVASDMLTRTSAKGDMAPDASVYPIAPDPVTGGRQLEELAFEIVSTQSLAAAGAKADALTRRGVRRVFALDVSRRRALEWSRKTKGWQILAPSDVIEDPALAVPLPVRELVSAAKGDDAVARALLAKQNPVLATAMDSARRDAKAEGTAEGKTSALLAVLAARGVPVSEEDARTIRATHDDRTIHRWLAIVSTCRTAEEMLRARGPSKRTAKKRNS